MLMGALLAGLHNWQTKLWWRGFNVPLHSNALAQGLYAASLVIIRIGHLGSKLAFHQC